MTYKFTDILYGSSGEEVFAGPPVEVASPPAQDCPICLRWCRVRGSLVEIAAEMVALDRELVALALDAEEVIV